MDLSGFIGPLFRDDLLSLPTTSVQIKLPEFGHIDGSHPETASCMGDAPSGLPCISRNIQRFEQVDLGKFLDRNASCAFNNSPYEVGTSRTISPVFTWFINNREIKHELNYISRLNHIGLMSLR